MRNVRDDQGFALVSAIILLTVILGLGLGLLLYTDNQQKASAHEQGKEAAFNVAEAALNAQVGQVSRAWPTEEGQPQTCTAATSTTTNFCPTAESMKVGYEKNPSPVPCPAGTPKDAWGSALTNQWTTYVRAPKTGSVFNSAQEKEALDYDKGGEGNQLWIRSVGAVQCQVVSLVTLVSRQLISTTFPKNAVTANSFKITNEGKKVLVNTQGKESQPAGVSMRCSGFKTKAECEQYRKEAGFSQIEPDTTESTPSSPPLTWSASQLEAVRKQAESKGTYYPAGKCPSGLPEGTPVYVEGPCEVSGGANEVANSEASPGFLVVANGTFAMGGGSTYYGVIYMANQQESSGVVFSLHSNAHVIGAVNVDGNGGVDFGSSHVNLEFSGKAIENLKVYAGATPTRNTFRELPISQ